MFTYVLKYVWKYVELLALLFYTVCHSLWYPDKIWFVKDQNVEIICGICIIYIPGLLGDAKKYMTKGNF